MLRIIFWTVVAVLFLSFFGVSIQGLLEDPTTQNNFDFVFDVVEDGWDTIWGFLSGIALAIEEAIAGILP